MLFFWILPTYSSQKVTSTDAFLCVCLLCKRPLQKKIILGTLWYGWYHCGTGRWYGGGTKNRQKCSFGANFRSFFEISTAKNADIIFWCRQPIQRKKLSRPMYFYVYICFVRDPYKKKNKCGTGGTILVQVVPLWYRWYHYGTGGTKIQNLII